MAVSLLFACETPRRRLTLLIVVDTLRADRLGCYGSPSVHTPNLDRLAAEGMLYESACSAAPITLPSITTILTGAYPVQHGIRDNGPFRLNGNWTTLAEHLRESGWATGAFVSAAVLSREHELDQGFTIYDDDVTMPYEPRHPLIVPMRDRVQGIERRAAVTVDRSLAWLREQKRGDVFLFVHLFDPHLPYDPPAPYDAQYRQDPYGGEVAYVDAEVGRLLEGVRKVAGDAEPLVLLVADHGEGLGDHGESYHGDLLYRETTRVPLLLRGKGVERGGRFRGVVRTIDIVPTICRLNGVEPPEGCTGEPLPGLGRTAFHQRTEPARGRIAYLESFRPRLSSNWCEQRGLRTDDWTLIEGVGCELYDRHRDPGEKEDLSAQRPEVCDSLLRRMDEAALTAARVKLDQASLELSDQQRARLRSLGYITPQSSVPATTDSLAVWCYPPSERGHALGLPDPRERLGARSDRIVANSYYQAGQALLAQGNYAQAARNFAEAIEHDEDLSAAYIGLAESALRADRVELATQTLVRAGKRFRHDPPVVVTIADALLRAGRPDRAYDVTKEAIAAAGRGSELLLAKLAALERLRGTASTSGRSAVRRG